MVQEAGMDPYLNVTVGHYNAKSEDIKLLLEYSKNQIYIAKRSSPSGMWKNIHDIICDEDDRKYLQELRKKYQNINGIYGII